MSEHIQYRRPHIEEAQKLAEFISRIREQTYDLDIDTMAYAHMVQEILHPDSIAELADMIKSAPAEGFARIAETPDQELVGLGLGRRGEFTDTIEHLFVRPDFRRRGIASTILQRHQRWATRDQSGWVLTSNTEGLAFWRSQHFKVTRDYTDPTIGLNFTRIERQKRRRKAA